jgi:hypothetical protein
MSLFSNKINKRCDVTNIRGRLGGNSTQGQFDEADTYALAAIREAISFRIQSWEIGSDDRGRLSVRKLRSLRLLVLFAFIWAIWGGCSPASAQTLGQWSAESPWPTVGVHLAILSDGRVVTWGVDTPPPGTTAFNTYVVTIPGGSTNTSAVQNLIINDDLFCAGETFLQDGRLFVSGGGDQPAPTNGTGRATTDIFNPSSNTWSSGPTMSNRRWYPTATTLPSGEVLNLLGSIDMNFTPNETPDITTNGATGIRSLTGVSAATLFYNYPRAFVAPNGKIFLAGMEQTSRYLDISGAGAYSTVASSIFGFRAYGSAVMYDNGKVLIAGGAPTHSAGTPTNTAEVIDLTAATPAWRNVGPMAFARRYLNATLMADGKVLITGGTASSPAEGCETPVLPAEIWDPATEKFTTVASMTHVRGYHSTAVLLPDGRVLSAGTTLGDGSCQDYKDADFYSPPYLFNGPRPSITSAPSIVNYGQQFTVATPDAANISNVNLIAFGAVTHHFNFSQRIYRASFSKGTNSLTVTAPASSTVSPPGKYMMFILNGTGVPSVASVVQILSTSTPTPTPTATQTATPTPSATPTPAPSAVKIVAPVTGASVSGTVSIVTQITAGVSWINVYIDGNYFTSSPPFTFSWNSTSVPNGSHTISARAFSSTGTQVGIDSVTVTVANGVPTPTATATRTATPTPAPTPTSTALPSPSATPTPASSAVKITAPANGASVSGTVSIVTQITAGVSWINIYIDGNYFASSPPFTFSWNSTSALNGPHTISARAFSSTGTQVGIDSISVTVAN